MSQIKKLHEQVGAVSKEIRTYLDSEARKAIADKSNDAKLKELEVRFDGLNADLEAELRQHARESGTPKPLGRQEERDVLKFDLRKVVQAMKAGKPLDGVEKELVQDGLNEARESGIETGSHGVVLPRMLVRRRNPDADEIRAMTSTGTTTTAGDQGGQLVATTPMGLADGFYNASVLRTGGALVLEDMRDNLTLPRWVKPTNPAKKTENAAADNVSPTLASLALNPCRLPASIDISDQLLRQGPAAFAAYVQRQITVQMADIQEVAFINGGGTNEPTGILGTSGIGAVVGGTNGLIPTWGNVVDLESAVGNANAAIGRLNYLTNTKVRGKLKQVAQNGAASPFCWTQGQLNGYAPLVTNAVPSTLTKGSASAICSALVYGNFNDFVIAYWGGLVLELLRDVTSASAAKSVLVANAYYNGGVLRPLSFAAMQDALTA